MIVESYKFKLPIGDWSNDGHGKCDYYIVNSNKPVDEVREIHFQIKEKTGINIHELANEYENSGINIEIVKKLKELGYLGEFSDMDKYKAYLDSYDLVNIWIFLLMRVDETLDLEIVEDEEIPMLPFYGFDEKGRHIDFVGYGVV